MSEREPTQPPEEHGDTSVEPAGRPGRSGPASRRRRLRRPASRSGVLALFAMVLVGGFLTLQVGRQVYQSYAISQRAAEIRAEIAEVRAQTVDLRAQLAYLQSDAYVTKEARRISNLGATDERVLIIPPGAEAELPPALREPDTPEPLLEQWVELFFGG